MSANISLDVIPAASPEEYLALSLITLIHFSDFPESFCEQWRAFDA